MAAAAILQCQLKSTAVANLRAWCGPHPALWEQSSCPLCSPWSPRDSVHPWTIWPWLVAELLARQACRQKQKGKWTDQTGSLQKVTHWRGPLRHQTSFKMHVANHVRWCQNHKSLCLTASVPFTVFPSYFLLSTSQVVSYIKTVYMSTKKTLNKHPLF